MSFDSAISPLLPALWMLAAAPLLLLLPSHGLRKIYMLILPLIGLILLWLAPEASAGNISILNHQLTLARLDELSRIFATMFFIGGFFAALFAWHVRDRLEQLSACLYAGAAIAAVMAGDLISLFIFWELTGLASLGIILARRTKRAYHAAFRYFMMQLASGLFLLAGVIMHSAAQSDIMFNAISPISAAGMLIFAAFAIKAAFPLVHYWLADAYPQATPAGTVFLSIFTTKLAIYALLRGFAGFEPLIYIGAAMAIYPALYAMSEHDLRRALAYSLNSQLGFMVAGIGIGTKLALNGAIAHAFCSVIYQALLFMSMGAVLARVGTMKASELGGLYRSMPQTMWLCLIGAASIAGMPLFAGFISKSLTIEASAPYFFVWISLLAANALACYHTAIRVPYIAFFGEDKKLPAREAPKHMRLAMAGLALICIALGLYPHMLYQLLPYAAAYAPYSYGHIVSQFELIAAAALASLLLIRLRFHLTSGINLDFDWIARALPYHIRNEYQESWAQAKRRLSLLKTHSHQLALYGLHAVFGKDRWLASDRPAGAMALWIIILLTVAMLFVYS